jgi:hypothetical protein
MKLYTVNVSFDFVMVADNIADAELEARYYFKEAISDMPRSDIEMSVVEGVSATGWDDECIPYGGDGNKRTGEYKNGGKA